VSPHCVGVAVASICGLVGGAGGGMEEGGWVDDCLAGRAASIAYGA
jgi:hypothetical protein